MRNPNTYRSWESEIAWRVETLMHLSPELCPKMSTNDDDTIWLNPQIIKPEVKSKKPTALIGHDNQANKVFEINPEDNSSYFSTTQKEGKINIRSFERFIPDFNLVHILIQDKYNEDQFTVTSIRSQDIWKYQNQ
jgi:hypothetical protein